jgi:hypothetical protein
MMKPQGQVATMTTTSAATPSKYTISFLMVAGLQKIGKNWTTPTAKKPEDLQPQIKLLQLERGHARLRMRS